MSKTKPVLNPQMIEQINERTAKLPENEQFLIANCIQNLLNGSSWGFMTKEMVEAYGDPMKFNNELTKVYSLAPKPSKRAGKTNPVYMVESNYQNALTTLQKVVPGVVNNEFVQEFKDEVQDSIESFKKFYAKASKEGFQGIIGFNSVNKTETMTFNGKRERAFQLPLSAVLGLMNDNNTRLNLGGIVTPSQVKANFEQYASKLLTSEGSTAVVVQLVIRGTGK
ncbi:hypothetical protein P4493_04705 [Bacillus thuringiensis]|uniref:Uncharacterized protein n=3 Tax=Bacillus thuringiensis TaxID=1428 RepID=A0A0B5NJH1_BACTU|nr:MULTISPECIES: hypothetical protein [Bacillus]MEC2535866.1 hypothetical protein [Bacillus cereus]MED1153707.1 hypothetical protein [Bacillus paranthracis]OUB09419.1 hypothetical protein BK708_33405 [Bacillus thuringiensis serovar yunnanensis]AFQ30027.1 hypothetical protein BTF1_29632 [Bacillus thuringiensis HD-789]AJG74076.1 hypothetical protein BF38_5821 [Bacillus thuringiensis]